MRERLYAVKVGPDWVELRLAPRPPKPIRSAVEVSGKRKVYDPHMYGRQLPEGPYRNEPFTYKLKVLAHEGGERLCIIPLERLRAICRADQLKMVWRQGLARVPKKLAGHVLDPTWRMQNAKP